MEMIDREGRKLDNAKDQSGIFRGQSSEETKRVEFSLGDEGLVLDRKVNVDP